MNTTGMSAPEPGSWAVTPELEYDDWRNSTDSDWSDSQDTAVRTASLAIVLVGLLGLVGNGTVIWLLGFRVKRNPFSVYILNLACADFLFLFTSFLWFMSTLTVYIHPNVNVLIDSVNLCSFLVSLSLLMAVSTDRCVSVLCPIWHRCHRPAHFSSVLCALIWVLGFCSGTAQFLCLWHSWSTCYALYIVICVISVFTCLVLCVSSLTILLWVQCCSRRRRLGRLHLILLLSVLAFLLLGQSFSLQFIISVLSPASDYPVLMQTLYLLAVLNSVVNPFIYFFVGRCRQPQCRKPLREVLQGALAPEEEEGERRGGLTQQPVPQRPLGGLS